MYHSPTEEEDQRPGLVGQLDQLESDSDSDLDIVDQLESDSDSDSDLDIVEVPVDLQVKMDIVEEIILLIEVIQEIDIIVDMIGEIIIGIGIDPYHQMKWIIILGDIKVEVIQDLDIQEIEDNHLKMCFL